MGDFLHAAYEVARKDMLQHLRTKRLVIIGSLMLASLVLFTLVLGPNIARGTDLGGLGVATENFVLLAYFSAFFVGGYFFIQLLSIVITADAVCSEWSSRTIFLLLSKPVSRTAFVVGKFAGSLFTVAAAIAVLLSVDYAVMQGFYAGAPSASEVAGFFGALGMLVLGAAAYASLALFFSTITRSTVMALLLTLGMWIIVFPLVGNLGFFIELGHDPPDLESDLVHFFRYLNPGGDMGAAGRLLVSNEEARGFLEFLTQVPESTGIAIVALVGHIALWFGLAVLVVQRRNFE